MPSPKPEQPSQSDRRAIEELRQGNTGRLLLRAARAYNERAIAKIREAGHEAVKPAHAAILPFIDVDGTRLNTVAQRAGMAKQSASEMIHELVASGYLRLAQDPADKRAQRVQFTDLGWRFLRDAHRVKKAAEREIDRALGSERAEELRELLRDFVAGF